MLAKIKMDCNKKVTLLEEKVAGHEERNAECEQTISFLRENVNVLSLKVDESERKLTKYGEIEKRIEVLMRRVHEGELAEAELVSLQS